MDTHQAARRDLEKVTFERSPRGSEGTTGAWGCWGQPGLEAVVPGVERGDRKKRRNHDSNGSVLSRCPAKC